MELQEVLIKAREILDIELFTVQSDPITIGSILIFVIFLTGFLTLGSVTRRVLHNKFLKKFDIDSGLRFTLSRVAEEHPKVMKLPKHQVHLTNFGDSSWDMQLRVWIPNVKERYILRNEINQAIVRKFKEHQIEIPFPQRDLHLRTSIAHPEEDSAKDRSTDDESEKGEVKSEK